MLQKSLSLSKCSCIQFDSSEQMYLHPIWFLWANVLASNLIPLTKCSCIQFGLLILGDKNDMNVLQDIWIWLRKPLVFECGKWKKAVTINALAIIWYLIIHVNSVWQAWFHISYEQQSSKMGLKHCLRKKKFRAPHNRGWKRNT